MAQPAFINLWNSYPTQSKPCDGPYDNQCAIRMSVTLNGEGTLPVNSGTYTEPKCKHGHARGAESLANWLAGKARLGAPKKFTSGADAKKKVAGMTGIIFFKDCFTRAGSTVQTGDHIDLWNKGITKTYNDPGNKAAQVWFWELA